MAEIVLKHVQKVYPNNESKKKGFFGKKKKTEEKKHNLKVTEDGVLAVEDFNLTVHDQEFVVLVGPSGGGKSTTMRMVAGLEDITSGDVLIDGKRVNDVAPKDRDIAMVFQSYALYPNMTVYENMAFTLELKKVPKDEIDRKVRSAAEILGITEYLDRKPKALSGGQRHRVDLARLLIGDYDVLMLDEPTNHLDMRTINWLARHLKARWQRGQGAMLVVTHDRWFLDEVCTSMWEVHDGQVDPFEGGYSAYILQRVERDRMAAVTEERRRNMARKELAWLSRGAQARSTKPKFRVDAARELIADVPPVRDELELKRLAVSRLGKQVIDVVDVDAGYADTDGAPKQVLTDVTWLIGAGDRYGLLGENGAGKSTLLDVIQGKIEPTRGRVKIGQTVRFGVLSQQLEELEPYMGDTIREVLSNYKKYYVIDGKETSPEKLCERLGFTTQQLWSRIGDLSGGQRRRLSLLLTILNEPNVLILDEPGNDLDTDMLAIVEDLLDGWPGTLILVTHDRFLMERVTDQQWALLDGHLTHMPGGVDQYLRLCNATAEGEPVGAPSAKTGTFDTGAAAAAAEKPKASGQPNGLSNAERQRLRREVSSLERKMETQRARVEEAEAAMAQVDPTNYTALGEQQAKIDEAHAAMDELEMAWLEASEKLEGEE